MMRENIFETSFKEPVLPLSSDAMAKVHYDDSNSEYHCDWTPEGTRFLLQKWQRNGETLLCGAGPFLSEKQNYLSSLDKFESETLCALRSHGDEKKAAGYTCDSSSGSRKVCVCHTAWFWHLCDHPEEIWVSQENDTMATPFVWEIANPSDKLLIDGVELEITKNAETKRISANSKSSFFFNLADSSRERKPTNIEVKIVPPENNRAFVDWRKPILIKAMLPTKELGIGGKAVLYGFDNLYDYKFPMDQDLSGDRIEIEFTVTNPRQRGIVPVAIRYEDNKSIGFGQASLWMPEVIIETDDEFLDGMYFENLRSAVHRFTFNTWREDEPRYPWYGEIFNRNILSPLVAFDNPVRLWNWTKLWFKALRSAGYMPESLGMTFPSFRDEQWMMDYHPTGNDGVGFTLLQWGKLYLRADDDLRKKMLREDLDDLLMTAQYIRRCLHINKDWIDDHSEPIDGIPTKSIIVGSPWAQSLCLAGASVVNEALKDALEKKKCSEIDELLKLYKSLSERLYKGLMLHTNENQRFEDLTSDQDQVHPHTYTNLTPGTFLTDPDIGDQRFNVSKRDILLKTIDFNKEYRPENRPFRILTCPYYPPKKGMCHNAYSQIGMIINYMSLDMELEAGKCLEELLTGSKGSPFSQRASDSKYTVLDWSGKRDEKFSKYIIPELFLVGYEDVKPNPGNGVCVSYYLYLIDRMIGINPKKDLLEIRPELSDQKSFSVTAYPTRMGKVDYQIKRNEKSMDCTFRGNAPMKVFLPVKSSAERLLVNGENTKFEKVGKRIVFHLEPGKYKIELR